MYDSAYSSLHPHESSQELRYYMFAVNLDRCGGSYNTLDNLYSMVCVPNETEELNIFLNLIIGINESRTLKKHISCKCECKFENKKCTSNQQ